MRLDPPDIRNPLGVIGLFVTLVYGFACLLYGVSGDALPAEAQWCMVIFVVSFPVLLLLAFLFLVTRHHEKLYAPLDYGDPRLFLRTLSGEERREKLASEMAEAESDEGEVIADSESQQPDEPEATRAAVVPGSNPRADYLLAEELALKKLEIEFGTQVYREVEIDEPFADRQFFDGVMAHRSHVVAIEVKYLTRPRLSQGIVERLLGSARSAAVRGSRAFGGLRPKILLVIVSNLEMPGMLERLRGRASGSPIPFEVRYYKFSTLKKEFGIDE
jgi:hypothetical protein